MLGQSHLQCIVKEFVTHYHLERPHESLDNRTLTGYRPHRNLCSDHTTSFATNDSADC
jgi:hypothetical protein